MVSKNVRSLPALLYLRQDDDELRNWKLQLLVGNVGSALHSGYPRLPAA
jgi:hypothetical protein